MIWSFGLVLIVAVYVDWLWVLERGNGGHLFGLLRGCVNDPVVGGLAVACGCLPGFGHCIMLIIVGCSSMSILKQEEAKEEEQASKSMWTKWKCKGIIGAVAIPGGTLIAITSGR
nr:transmembrane and coiled-coil domain-containing protein 4-like [Tanacetum cinerariifolium]